MLDQELLNDYVGTASQEAFAAIVSMHIDAVYSAARRQVRDPQLAQDVTQAVFIVLARRAERLVGSGPLLGWLIKTAHYASMDALKKQARRLKHEREAAAMKTIVYKDDRAPSGNEELSLELDGALSKLSDADRCIISLRYLESLSLFEVGQVLGISSHAATKRISRALDRLRRILAKRERMGGLTPVPLVLEQLHRLSAPADLARVAASAATGGALPSVLVANISQGVVRMLLWSSLKPVLIGIAAFLIVGVTGIATMSLVSAQATGVSPLSATQPTTMMAVSDIQAGYVARLKNDVSVELIGVAEYPSTGKQWWSADGKQMSNPPYHHGDKEVVPGSAGGIPRELAVRIGRKPVLQAEPASLRWRLSTKSLVGMSSGSWWGTGLDAAGHTVAGIQAIAFNLIDNMPASFVAHLSSAQEATLRVEVAAGPWKTMLTSIPLIGGNIKEGSETFELQPAAEVAGEVRFTLRISGRIPSLDERVVAIDFDDNQHIPMLKTRRMDRTSLTDSYSVPVTVDSLKAIQFQRRKFDQWIEIRNIALNAGHETKVMAVTSDLPSQGSAPQ